MSSVRRRSFRVSPVMTTSIPLHIKLPTDSLSIIAKKHLSVNVIFVNNLNKQVFVGIFLILSGNTCI